MEPTLKERYYEWYNKRMKPKFYKGWSYIVAAIAVIVGLLPDLINLVLQHWSMIDTGLPTLSSEHKLWLFAAASVAKLFLTPIRQEPGSLKIAKVPPDPSSGDDPGA